MKRFGLVMGGIVIMGLALASSGCHEWNYPGRHGRDYRDNYRGHDRDNHPDQRNYVRGDRDDYRGRYAW